jgi:hypothetical protein
MYNTCTAYGSSMLNPKELTIQSTFTQYQCLVYEPYKTLHLNVILRSEEFSAKPTSSFNIINTLPVISSLPLSKGVISSGKYSSAGNRPPL